MTACLGRGNHPLILLVSADGYAHAPDMCQHASIHPYPFSECPTLCPADLEVQEPGRAAAPANRPRGNASELEAKGLDHQRILARTRDRARAGRTIRRVPTVLPAHGVCQGTPTKNEGKTPRKSSNVRRGRMIGFLSTSFRIQHGQVVPRL